MADQFDAWQMLKNTTGRGVRYSVYFVATWGWLSMVNKFVSVSRVSGTSMLPHLEEGDWILKESFSFRFFPERNPISVGDVVVFKSPLDKSVQHVKRVIALEGDIIPLKGYPKPSNTIDYDGYSVVVPPGSIWVEGDNRFTSKDSRHYGAVSQNLLTYRVVAKIYPTWTKLSNPWLVRLLNGDVKWKNEHEPTMTPPS